MNRRSALRNLSAVAASAFVTESLNARMEATNMQLENSMKGKINHSACRWCYSGIPLDELCKRGKEMGLVAIDLLNDEEWATAAKYGLASSLGMVQPQGYGIPKGFNRIENHKTLVEFYTDLIPKAANAGVKQLICFSGNRGGLSDNMGITNCAIGLKQLMKVAEKNKVTLVMELLNSKVDHKDYQCDHTEWGVALCEATGSEYFKLLYDIYHMQIMEGDVIRNIRDYNKYISHYHTGGVPGRNEIDDSQELYYPAIMKAIVETGFKGFVAQEFIPKATDKLASLDKCVKICDI
jgi:hydroxypyruvate isomerase